MTEATAEIPPELFARLAHPTVRLSGSLGSRGGGSSTTPFYEVPPLLHPQQSQL
jgi:hypothetical protein